MNPIYTYGVTQNPIGADDTFVWCSEDHLDHPHVVRVAGIVHSLHDIFSSLLEGLIKPRWKSKGRLGYTSHMITDKVSFQGKGGGFSDMLRQSFLARILILLPCTQKEAHCYRD